MKSTNGKLILLARLVMLGSHKTALPSDMFAAKSLVAHIIGGPLQEEQELVRVMHSTVVCSSCNSLITLSQDLPIDFVTECGTCRSTVSPVNQQLDKQNNFYLLSIIRHYLPLTEYLEIKSICNSLTRG